MEIIRGAESRVSQPSLDCIKMQGNAYKCRAQRQGRGWGGGRFPPQKMAPPCVKRGPYMYNTPQQKIYAKVKCPNLYTYF